LAVNKNNFVEKVNELINDKEKRRELTERAYKWAIEYYDNEKVLKQLMG